MERQGMRHESTTNGGMTDDGTAGERRGFPD